MRIYSIILVLTLVACKSNKPVESSSPLSIDNKSIYHVDTSRIVAKNDKARNKDVMELSNWTKLISNHKVGFLKTGDSITQTLDILEDYFNIVFDSIPYCSGCMDNAEYYYKLMNDSLNLSFTIHPGQTQEQSEVIQAFVMYDTLYRTDKGIGVGNTLKDIKSKYTVSKIIYEQECGLFLFVDGFDGSFGLEFEPDSDTYDVILKDIPQDVMINQIAIY